MPETKNLIEIKHISKKFGDLTVLKDISLKVKEKEVVVTGNPRVYKALKKELEKVLSELKRLKKGEDVPEDLLEVIRLITITMAGMKAE